MRTAPPTTKDLLRQSPPLPIFCITYQSHFLLYISDEAKLRAKRLFVKYIFVLFVFLFRKYKVLCLISLRAPPPPPPPPLPLSLSLLYIYIYIYIYICIYVYTYIYTTHTEHTYIYTHTETFQISKLILFCKWSCFPHYSRGCVITTRYLNI